MIDVMNYFIPPAFGVVFNYAQVQFSTRYILLARTRDNLTSQSQQINESHKHLQVHQEDERIAVTRTFQPIMSLANDNPIG